MVGGPPFLSRPLPVPLSDRLQKKMNKKSVWEVQKFPNYLERASNFGIHTAVRRVQMWLLKDNISSESITSTLNFV